MCDRDRVNQHKSDRRQCLYYDFDTEAILRETSLAQDSLVTTSGFMPKYVSQDVHLSSIYQTDSEPILEGLDSHAAVMRISDDIHVQNSTTQCHSSVVGPSSYSDHLVPNEPTGSESYWNEMYSATQLPQAFMAQATSQAMSLPWIETPHDQTDTHPHASSIPAGEPDDDGSESMLQESNLSHGPSESQKCNLLWINIRLNAIILTGSRIFVPQALYSPFTNADKDRYLERVSLLAPIIFETKEPIVEWGISLEDVCDGRTQDLVDKDVAVLRGCGSSISIRICWPGYPPFKHQCSSHNFRKKKGPITKEKLARNVAKVAVRFIEKMSNRQMDDGADRRWKVGPLHIKAEDLILVSIHHVSKGSWQPQFRLRHDPVEEM